MSHFWKYWKYMKFENVTLFFLKLLLMEVATMDTRIFPRPDSTKQPASTAVLPLTRPISIDEFQLHDVNPLSLTSSCHRSFNVHPRNVYLRFHVRVRAVRSIATRVPARITCKTHGKTRLFIAKRYASHWRKRALQLAWMHSGCTDGNSHRSICSSWIGGLQTYIFLRAFRKGE